MRKLAILSFIFSFIAWANGFMDTAWADGEVTGTVIMHFRLSHHCPKEEARLWVPYPPSDKYQLIDHFKISGTQTEWSLNTDRKFGRLMVFARWDKGVTDRRLTLSFHVSRRQRLDKDLPDKEPCWDRKFMSDFLSPSSRVSLSRQVKALSKRIVSGRNQALDKALAIYDWVIRNMSRKPETCFCGEGDVDALLTQMRGNCVDIHSVTVALLRASGVAAREVFGLRLSKSEDKPADVTKGQHCWVEFYLPGYGWVVMDPADVLKKMLIEGLDIHSAKARKYYHYFFGAVDPYRVRLGTGRDLTLNPPGITTPLNYFMYPYGEIGKQVLDEKDPTAFSYTITFMPDSAAKGK